MLNTTNPVSYSGFVPIPHVRYDKSSDVLLFSIKNKVTLISL